MESYVTGKFIIITADGIFVVLLMLFFPLIIILFILFTALKVVKFQLVCATEMCCDCLVSSKLVLSRL